MLCAPLDLVKSASSMTLVVALTLKLFPKRVPVDTPPLKLVPDGGWMVYSGKFPVAVVGGRGMVRPSLLGGCARFRFPSGAVSTKRENEILKSARSVGENVCVMSCVAAQ